MMMTAHVMSAFIREPGGGNPAGVVLDSEHLEETQMQEIAARLGYSETAFISRSQEADFAVRFFTPNAEVDLCGHATIASFALLKQEGRIGGGEYTQLTKAGVLSVAVSDAGEVLMDQTLPAFGPVVDSARVAATLGIGEEHLLCGARARIVSTGLPDVMVPVRDLEVLRALKPDFEAITELSRELGVTGYHVFALESLRGATGHCRNFAPLYDIPEEAATGTSNGALACYLIEEGLVEAGKPFVFEQGDILGRPSEIRVIVDGAKGDYRRVRVGGRAIRLMEHKLSD